MIGLLRGVTFGAALYLSLVVASLLALPVLFSERAVRACMLGVSKYTVPLSLWAGAIRVTGKGMEHVHACKDGYILIANHASNVDPLAMMQLLRRINLNFVAKVETLRRPFLGRLLRAIEWLPVERESLAALKKLIELVREKRKVGWVPALALFPEGTRSEDGKLKPFKIGPFMLAAELGLPIVPVVIRGTFPIHKRNAFRVYPGPVHVEFHPPIAPPALPTGKTRALAAVDAAAALKKQAEVIFTAAADLTVAGEGHGPPVPYETLEIQ